MMLSLQQLAAALGGEVSGDQVLAPGPGHNQKDRSMCVKLGFDDYIVHSFAGDDWKLCRVYIDEKIGIPKWEPKKVVNDTIVRMSDRVRKPKAKAGSTPATYIYKLADGTPYLRVVRPGFYQSHWSGSTWISGAPKGLKIPYRLPELLAAQHNDVLIVEGEKDADNVAALGFTVTTNSGGAGKFTSELAEYFKNKNVYILPDNDEAGADHARQVAVTLRDVARSIHIVKLYGLPTKGDVSDWIEAGGGADQLANILRNAPKYEEDDQSLPWLDISSWDHAPMPERQWAIRDRVPLNQAGLFSGEGGTGKSVIELMKDVAHVAGKDWLGSMPEPGPAFYLGGEDDKDEIHIRLAAIAKQYGVTFQELYEGGLHILPLLGKDMTLCAVTAGGKIETTRLYRQIYEAAGDIKPKNISIDTLSRAFAGNEVDRVQVYAFAMHMQALAKVAEGSVTVLSHPSLQGINSGSGISGSTAWHGAFRFRQYLKGVKASDGEQPDNDLRELEFKKNQYGPLGESIIVRYQHGLFLPEHGISNLDKAARSARAEDLFIELLRQFSRQNRNVSDKATAPNYAPTAFAREEDAKKCRIKKPEFEQAMRDLFKADKLRVENYGRPSRPSYKLVLAEGAAR
jgi:RecA-family ATPase/5S rRNA maturation endonuclease (ribonuclease M5)